MDNSTNKSKLMDMLYGDSAEAVYERLSNLDPSLNELIQTFAYDKVWQLPPLNLREKSLVTVSALVALGKPEQLRMHMIGFLHCGGSISQLRAVLIHLCLYCGFPASLAAFAVLSELEEDKR